MSTATPFPGSIVTSDPKPKLIDPQRIPNDRTVILVGAHPDEAREAEKKNEISIIEWRHPDDHFRQGPVVIKHEIQDPDSLLSDQSAEIEADHEIRSIKDFALMPTLVHTVRLGDGLDEMQRRPLLMTAIRPCWMNDFTKRLGNPQFVDLLESQLPLYREQLRKVAAYLSELDQNSDAPRPDEINLLKPFLTGIRFSITGDSTAIEFAAAPKLLTHEHGTNVERLLRLPIVLNSGGAAPVDHRHLFLDRLRFEEKLLGLYQGGTIAEFKKVIQKRNAELHQAAQRELEKVFDRQRPLQEKHLALHELWAQAERRNKRDKPFITVNMDVPSLLADNGAKLGQLSKMFPGRRTLNHDKSVSFVTLLESGLHPQQIETLGRFAYEKRAILVLPMYAHETLDEVQEAVEPGGRYHTLAGIRQSGEEWKRVVFPVARNFDLVDPNPFNTDVRLPMACITTGQMIDASDTPALPPAGNRFPIVLRGALLEGVPLHPIREGEDLDLFQSTANPPAERRQGVCVLWNNVTLACNDPGFDEVNLIRCRHILEKDVSEMLLHQMYSPDGEPQRKALRQAIDDYILANSDEASDDKMFAGGRVREIRFAVDPTTKKECPGILHISLEIRFKQIIRGAVLEIKNLPVELIAEKNDQQTWSLQ